MSYSNSHLERNRYSGQATQSAFRTFLVIAEESIKFLFNFIHEMWRMVVGK